MDKTTKQFDAALADCERIFIDKMGDYGPSWRVLRPSTVTDQLLIKARRIRRLEMSGMSAVGEGILPEFIALVNYGAMGIVQLERGPADSKDMSAADALAAYRDVITRTRGLMLRKNTDYDEAWRMMRVSSYTDLILTKIERIKEIEGHDGATTVSEGIDSNYQDIINYAVFAVIKLTD